MRGRIVLVRHGLSSHTHRGALDRAGVEQWRAAYDAAGIQPTPAPPAELVAAAASSTHIIASDLKRAIESARLLAPSRDVRIEPLLRETPLPIPRWPMRLPLAVWGTISYAGWNYRRLRGADVTEPDWLRAGTAARWLAELVADGSSAMVVTHGIFRKLLTTHLTLLKWTESGRVGGYRHWSAWGFARRAAAAGIVPASHR